MKKKILIISVVIGVIFVTLGILIFWTYKYGPDPREEDAWLRTQQYDKHKIISFENEFDSIEIGLSFYFNYSKTSRQDSNFINIIDTDSYVANKDTLYISVSRSSKSYEVLPIFRNDSIPFPESFSIKIHDRRQYYNDTKLKELDYNLFKEYAIPSGITDKEDFLLANEWTLVIDSTLLDLK
ncbi:MAG TPA: hypothetical protein DIT04_13625 [Dysgonomonas sp.]|nr:hypothetical protein [Dysgonomonas sp.]